MSGIGYRSEIDGLRAIAVIPVILFHLGFSWIPGGFIGVDVFFVISGFLITSIIGKDLEEGTFSFRDFWARRVRRILPALVFVTGCSLAVTYLFVFRLEQQVIGKQALAAIFSVANIYYFKSAGDYWGSAAEESPFLHTWSLSVEEQFYLLFPIAMWLIFRYRSRWLQVCMATAVVWSLALFLWGLPDERDATFYLLPTRVWELGTGCLLAVSLGNHASKTSNNEIFAIAGLAAIVLAYLSVDTLNAGVVLAVFGTALILAFGETGVCRKLLSQRQVVHVGKLSYSLYLWHWPALVLAEPMGFDWDTPSGTVIYLGVIYLLASVTYRFIEQPTRRKKGIIPVVLLSAILVAGAAFAMSRLPRSYDTSYYETPRWVEYNCVPNWKPETLPMFTGVNVTHPYYQPNAFSSGNGIQINCETRVPRVVLFGDSHGTMWSDAVVGVAKQTDLPIALFTMNKGENPFFEIPVRAGRGTGNLSASERLKYDQMRLKALASWKPDLVIIAARWEANHLAMAKDLLGYLESKSTPVILIEDPPQLPIPNTNLLNYLASQHLLVSDTVHLETQARVDKEKHATVRSIAEGYSNVSVLPTYDLFVSNEQVMVVEDRIPLYLDDDHVTAQGANKIADRLREAIAAALSPSG